MQFDILKSTALHGILENYKLVQRARKLAAFNLFSISSYASHLENFHSDILATLLDRTAVHGENDRFLRQFIKYLGALPGINLRPEDFANTNVVREQGRLDICITDEVSKKAIIIESKVNNAPDMDRQIDRYYDYLQHIKHYDVQLIIYLSLDGFKLAPKTTADIDGHGARDTL